MISINARQDPTGKLGPEPWLTAPATVRIMDVLTAEGADVRFVGGCVRDALSRQPVTDIDIGTPDAPEKVIGILTAAGIKAVPTGIDHGTITAVVEERTFEVTTLRRDVETDGRRAVVAFTDDWIVDSARRDFTINALSATRDGDIYDYHDGIPDLAHGRVRFINRADDRIEEDYLRILRYFRFFGRFGRPPYDAAAFNACRKHAERLSTISVERIRHELLRILVVSDPAEVFLMMRNAHVLDVVLPEADDIGRLRATAWLAARALVIEGLGIDPIRHLGAVLSAGTDVSDVAARLRLSNREADRLARMTAITSEFDVAPDVDKTRQLIHAHGGEAVSDAAMLAWGARLAERAKLPADETQARRMVLETAFDWSPPALPVGGEDAKALGVPHGPKIGAALRQVEDWWAAGGFSADRDACLAKLKDIVAAINDQDEG